MLLKNWYILLILFITGCAKLVALPDRDSQPISGTDFANDQQAMSTMNGLKARAMQVDGAFVNGANTIYPALSADELMPTGRPVLNVFAENRLSSDNIYVAILYNTAYSLIANINIVLEGLGSGKVSAALRDRLKGECLCMRALIYSRLIGLFGAVPLVVTTNVNAIAESSRAPVLDVYRQAIDDLQAADSLLPADYVVVQGDLVARTSPTRWVARGLLARFYLYLGRWADAETMATSVLGQGALALEPNPDSVFLSVSREVMWQLLPLNQGVNAEAAYFLSTGFDSKPSFVLHSSLLQAFEPGDRRKTAWTATYSSGEIYPFKYKIKMNADGKECNVLLRLGEQYLIRAEARAQQQHLAGAIDDLNVLRQRAGLTALQQGLSQQQVLMAVGQERRIELMFEWGHRWVDLKRTGQADAVLGRIKTAWKPTAALYPLPAGELKRDAHLIQNPGY